MTDKPKQETAVTQLSPNRVQLAEHAHNTFVACPEAGTPPEAVLDPKYWAHYSVNPNMQMKPGDIILVKPEDGVYFMELMVRATFRGGANVVTLRLVKLDKDAEAGEDMGDHELKFSGPRLKWRVIRKSDKRDLQSGLPSRDAARDWLKEHMKAFAA